VPWQSQLKDKPGEMLAVDAQPDNTVGIKRFWPGNFLLPLKRWSASPVLRLSDQLLEKIISSS